VPLELYGEADIRRAFHMRKSCSTTCAVAYAHQASRMDGHRPQDHAVTTIEKRSWSESSELARAAANDYVPLSRLTRLAG
jgi:hypothetical protein